MHGNQFESNGFTIWGSVLLLLGIGFSIIALVDNGQGIIFSLFLLILGIILLIIGSYITHLGELVLRDKKNNNIETSEHQEIKEDNWDKIDKKLAAAKIKVKSGFLENKNSLKVRLKELKDLLDEGLITEDEYNKKKNKLLDLD